MAAGGVATRKPLPVSAEEILALTRPLRIGDELELEGGMKIRRDGSNRWHLYALHWWTISDGDAPENAWPMHNAYNDSIRSETQLVEKLLDWLRAFTAARAAGHILAFED